MKQTTQVTGGMGFVGWLTILFIGLKLTGHIDWSWWWVLSPIWIPMCAASALFVGVVAWLMVFGEKK